MHGGKCRIVTAGNVLTHGGKCRVLYVYTAGNDEFCLDAQAAEDGAAEEADDPAALPRLVLTHGGKCLVIYLHTAGNVLMHGGKCRVLS